MRHLLLLPALVLTLTACDRLGIPDPAQEAAKAESEGKAIGSACRHSGRALEDCFALNPSAQKAAVFAGWREMNDYMIQNKLESVRPELPMVPLSKRRKPEDSDAQDADGASAPAADASAAASAPRERRRIRRDF